MECCGGGRPHCGKHCVQGGGMLRGVAGVTPSQVHNVCGFKAPLPSSLPPRRCRPHRAGCFDSPPTTAHISRSSPSDERPVRRRDQPLRCYLPCSQKQLPLIQLVPLGGPAGRNLIRDFTGRRACLRTYSLACRYLLALFFMLRMIG